MDNIVKKSNASNKIKTSSGDKVFYTIVNICLGIFTLLILVPLVNIVACSFSSVDAVKYGYVTIWPVDLSVAGYKAVFSYQGIGRSYLNTFIYTIVGTSINLAMTMICAYPMSRKRLPFHGTITTLFMFTMYFGGGTIPNYLLIRDLHMLDTIWAMVIPGAMSVYNMIIARTFINNIPSELEEAATIDGCSDIMYFFSMVLPLSGTVMAVLALYYAVGHWNDYHAVHVHHVFWRRHYPQLPAYPRPGHAGYDLGHGNPGRDERVQHDYCAYLHKQYSYRA